MAALLHWRWRQRGANGLVLAVFFMLTYPESAYRAKFIELVANDALTPDGAELTADEQAQLDGLKKRFKLEAAKVSAWEQQERTKLGHDAYRETFTRLYTNREAAAGNQLTPPEREQLNQLAKEQRISPTRTTAFETVLSAKLDEQRRGAPKELLALLYDIYSDELKADSEQRQLEEVARKYHVLEAQLLQSEREIQQRWRQAKPDFQQGLRLTETRDFAGAAAAFRRAAQADGENPWVLSNLAAALLEAGQLEEARQTGEKAVQAGPQNWLAHYNLGCLHARKGDKDLALNQLSTALSNLGTDPALPLNRTAVAARMKTDESLKSLRQDPRFQQLLVQQ
jgi:tetratricopeptide (TPR) repeat protein